MSVSVHMNGRKRADMKAPLATHQVRLDEEDGKKALKDTDSAIDPKLSHMNRALVPDQSRQRFKDMKKKIDTISEKRVAEGRKRVYKSANVFMVGTLQIGDDSLEKLGWQWDEEGKKLPADKQSERTIENVNLVYADMMRSVQQQPEIYGEVFSATLHMDEGSPHVDFMTDVLDVNEPDKLVAHYLNGPKGTPKGEKLRKMQDNIMQHSRFSERTIDQFELRRGDSEKKKIDKVKNIRREEKNLDSDRTSLNARRDVLDEWEGEIKRRESMVAEREEMAKFNDNRLKVSRTLLDAKIDRLEALEDVEGRFNETVDKYRQNPKKMANVRSIMQKFKKPMKNKDIVQMSEELDEVNGDGEKTLNEQRKDVLQERGLADFDGDELSELNKAEKDKKKGIQH